MNKTNLIVSCILTCTLTSPLLFAEENNLGDRVDARLDRKGDRIEERLDNKGDRIEDRLDSRAETAREAGKNKL
ncbi:MAG: hypothetical protein HN764_17920, partial [Gammaproteobacteria bacterium]|nr:hypothetical protein [Gammaproteobacteria bacterium]